MTFEAFLFWAFLFRIWWVFGLSMWETHQRHKQIMWQIDNAGTLDRLQVVGEWYPTYNSFPIVPRIPLLHLWTPSQLFPRGPLPFPET